MAINNSCVVMFVGHGATSASIFNPNDNKYYPKTTTNSSYCLNFPVTPLVSLDILGNNVIVGALSQTDSPFTELTRLLRIRGTSHYNHNFGFCSDLGDQTAEEQVKRYTIAQHTMSNADDVLKKPSALRPDLLPGYITRQPMNLPINVVNDLTLRVVALQEITGDSTKAAIDLGNLSCIYSEDKIKTQLNSIKKANAYYLQFKTWLNTPNNVNIFDNSSTGLAILRLRNAVNDINFNGNISSEILNDIPLHHLVRNNGLSNYLQNQIINIAQPLNNTHLFYFTFIPYNENPIGMNTYWSSFLQGMGCFKIAYVYTNGDWQHLYCWFSDPIDNVYSTLKGQYGDNLYVLTIPTNANIVFGACRVLCVDDNITYTPLNGQPKTVTVIPQY